MNSIPSHLTNTVANTFAAFRRNGVPALQAYRQAVNSVRFAAAVWRAALRASA